MTTNIKKKVPIKKGLFRISEDGKDGYLTGSHCPNCGETFFPMRKICANCFSEAIEEVPLEKKGTIVSYSIVQTGFPGSSITPPFICGIVGLPKNLRILTLISGFEHDKVEIGAPVGLYFWKVTEDENGNELMAYAFSAI